MKTDADMVTTERIESIIEMLDSVIGDGTLLQRRRWESGSAIDTRRVRR